MYDLGKRSQRCFALKTDIIHSSELGKTAFLTKEEAEKALAERGKV